MLERTYMSSRSSLTECRACGLCRFMPEPNAADLVAFYNHDMGRNDTKIEYSADAKAAVAQLADKIVNLTGLKQPYIHDEGCGSGYVVQFLRELGFESTGTDISQVAIDAGRALGNEHIYAEPTTELLSRLNAAPDVIFSQHSFEHFYNPVEHLKTLRGCLSDGGFVFCFVPNRDYLPVLTGGFDFDPAFIYPMHLNYFTAAGLRCIFQQAKFDVIHLENTKNLAFAPHMKGDILAAWRSLDKPGADDEEILGAAANQLFLYELLCVAKAI